LLNNLCRYNQYGHWYEKYAILLKNFKILQPSPLKQKASPDLALGKRLVHHGRTYFEGESKVK